MSSVSVRGVVSGLLGLTALQAITSTPAAAQRTGALFTGAAALFKYLVDPAVPLIPDRRTGAEKASASTKAAGAGFSGLAPIGKAPATATTPPKPGSSAVPPPQVAPAPSPVPTKPAKPPTVTPNPQPGPAPHP